MSARSILITGGNGGLGRAIAQSFLDEAPGNVIWLGVRRRREAADALAAAVPGRVRVVELDVTDPAAWASVIAAIAGAGPELDVLVNNAGSHADALLATMPATAWTEVRSANLDGVFHGCQAVLPALISRRHGRIINIASLSALAPPAGQANYAAAKAGAVALTQSLAKEVARLGITVNAVCPGYVDTEALGGFSPEQRQAAIARVPMRRLGQPAEVAAVVRFLACPEAGYVTGSVIKVDGGLL